jgi:hypothetical protein
MTHKLLSDTWYTREIPVLLEVARQLEGRSGFVDGGSVGRATVEQLLRALRQAEDLTDDPDDKSALRKAGGRLATVSRRVIAEAIAAVVT